MAKPKINPERKTDNTQDEYANNELPTKRDFND